MLGWKFVINCASNQIRRKYFCGTYYKQASAGRSKLFTENLINYSKGNGYNYSSRANMSESNLKKFRLALVQLAVSSNKEENVQNAIKLIEEAAKEGAQVVGLPECFNSPYGIQFFSEYAEEVPSGPTSQQISSLAKKLQIYIIAGSIPERGEDSKLFNTCVIYGPAGEVLGKHRKVHLFDIDVPGKITFQESKVLSPGNSLTMVDTKFCKFGIGICYDMRFPQLAEIYRKSGCDVLFYPGAFNMTTGPAHWQILQQGRAVDNQVFVATIAPARDEVSSYIAWGHSMIVDPWGKILAEAQESQTIIYADIDLSLAKEVRKQIPISLQGRPDFYAKNTEILNNGNKTTN